MRSRAEAALPSNPYVHEILEYVGKQQSKMEQDEALKEYRNDALISILIWNFDETVVSMIPEGDVPFTPNDSPQGTDHTSLRREQRNLYHFVKGGNDSLNNLRRESMFIQMLEGLHPSEAKIVVLAKYGRLKEVYAVTYEQAKEEQHAQCETCKSLLDTAVDIQVPTVVLYVFGVGAGKYHVYVTRVD